MRDIRLNHYMAYHSYQIYGYLTLFLLCLVGYFVYMGLSGVLFFVPTFVGTALLWQLIRESVQRGSTFFHPIPLVCAVMIWAYCISPAYAVYVDPAIFFPPSEIAWESALARMSWLYFFCVVSFYLGCHIRIFPLPQTQWRIDKRKLLYCSALFLPLTFLAQCAIFAQFGGLIGYMQSWSDAKESFDNLGTLFMVSEAFPILLFMVVIFLMDRDALRRNRRRIVLLLIVFFIIKMVFGGFRGSRSNTIWGLFWFAGIFHLYIRPFKLRHFVIGSLFLFAFMQVYSLYKSFGIDSFSGQYTLEDTSRFGDSVADAIFLNDFSRVGNNAYIVERFNNGEYQLKFGQTYLSSLLKMTPPLARFFPLYSKNSAGIESFYGSNVSTDSQYYANTRIYGPYGEGFLNFGPYLPILIFLLLGVVIMNINDGLTSLSRDDPRILLVPFVTNGLLLCALSDSDNVVFFVFKNGLFALVFLRLASVRLVGRVTR